MCVHAAQSSLLVAECEFHVGACVREARLLLLLVCVCLPGSLLVSMARGSFLSNIKAELLLKKGETLTEEMP